MGAWFSSFSSSQSSRGRGAKNSDNDVANHIKDQVKAANEIEENLWLGDISSSVDRASLDEKGIKYIVRCIPEEHFFTQMYPEFDDVEYW